MSRSQAGSRGFDIPWSDRIGARSASSSLALAALLPAAVARARRDGLRLPDLASVTFLGGTDGRTLLMAGMGVCALGMVFGLMIYMQLNRMPVHRAMLEISRAHLRDLQDVPDHADQVHPRPRGAHRRHHGRLLRRAPAPARSGKVALILVFSLIGIAGSSGVAWFGIRDQHLRQLAHGVRRAQGQALPDLRDPAQGRHEHRHGAHLRRALRDAHHPALRPRRVRRLLLHRLRHRRVARRLGAPHRGRHLHQDRRHRLRPDEDRLQHQGRRRAQPRRHRRLHRRQRGRLGRPDRRRLRDLRRHRRRAHHLHPPRRHDPQSASSCSSGSSRCAS